MSQSTTEVREAITAAIEKYYTLSIPFLQKNGLKNIMKSGPMSPLAI